jgi:uncharacterized protein involved in exopolysaccharide biosynthesis
MYRQITLRLLETFYRHRWLYITPLIVMVIATGVYFTVMKRDYLSQGTLLVNGQSLLASLSSLTNSNSNVWVTPAQSTASEINELIRTDAFIRAIVQQTDLEDEMTKSPKEVNQLFVDLRTNFSITTIGDNQTLIAAANDDPKIAYQLVDSLINNYIQWKIKSKKTESQTALTFFSNLIDQYNKDVQTASTNLRTYLLQHPEPTRGERPYVEQFEIDNLTEEVKLAQTRYNNALDKEENAKLSLEQVETDAAQTYVIVDAPEIPTQPETSLTKVGLNLSVFIVAGLLLSIGLLFVSYLLDKTIRFPLDVGVYLGDLPVLAVIPDTSVQKGNSVKNRFLFSQTKLLGAPHNLSQKVLTPKTEQTEN